MSDEEEERRRRAEQTEKAVTTLRVISNDNAGALEASDAGELREAADLLEDGRKASWMRQAWTLFLLRRYFFPG